MPRPSCDTHRRNWSIACLLALCAQVDEVKGIMTENIDKVLARGEKLELLTDKTENLMNEVRLPQGAQTGVAHGSKAVYCFATAALLPRCRSQRTPLLTPHRRRTASSGRAARYAGKCGGRCGCVARSGVA
jgi:hypothetical protein